MDVPSHRACAQCRNQKVRCLPDEGNPDVCQRCARLGRPCVFVPLQKRKQRKRTDTRVAELEREMRSMRALLKDKSNGDDPENSGDVEHNITGAGDGSQVHAQMDPSPNVSGQSELMKAGQHALRQHRRQSALPGPSDQTETVGNAAKPDVVDRGLLSMEVARRLVEHYKCNLYPQYPQVYVPCTADELRQSRPVLFLAVITAGAESEDADLAKALDNEVLQEYANRSVVQCEKSVELVQSLLISAVWYLPPNTFGRLATMAADIGITTRPSKLNRSRFAAKSGTLSPSMHPSEDFANPDLSMSVRAAQESEGTGNIECRRAFLACYAICVGVSISLRRPAMMRVTSYTKECLDFLEASPYAAPGDHLLVAWTRLWMIGEEIANALSYDDPGDTASLLDTTTQLLVTAFEKRLTEWRARYTDAECTPSLQVMYFTLRLFLHELVLHIDHSPEDFRAPYQMGVIHPCGDRDIPIKPVVESITDLVSSSHSLIDVFVSMGPETARFQPIFAYVRVSFAAFVLAKLCLSAYSEHSRLANVIVHSSLKAEHFVDKLILFVQSVIGSQERHVPSLFLALLFKLREWCTHPELIQQAETRGAPTDIWPEGLNKAREHIAIEGPRITEAMNSSTEPSPETASGQSDIPSLRSMQELGQRLLNPNRGCVPNVAARSNFGKHLEAGSSQAQSINIPSTPQSAESFSIEGYEEFFARFDRDSDKSGPSTASRPNATSQIGTATAAAADWPIGDQMDLDSSMFSFLNNMNDFTQGGLTGLEDWDSFAADLGPVQQPGDWEANAGPQQ